jgi:putative transposase
MKGRHKLSWLCEALMVSRSGYYDWIRRREAPGKRATQNAELCARIEQEFTRSRQTYGSHRIVRALGGGVSRNRVARLMRERHLRARQRSKYRVRTTDSRHGDPIAPNRLPGIKIVKPDQVWATDATGVLTGQGWLYVVALIDLFTRRIVGWSMSDNLDANMACSALKMALASRRPPAGLVVHSDRGTQFASLQYRTVLRQHECVASMSRQGNAYDNAYIESFWSSLKYELVYHRKFATRLEARSAVFDYIESFYNRSRLHSSLGYVSPAMFEAQLH